jgi:hypothetical protein
VQVLLAIQLQAPHLDALPVRSISHTRNHHVLSLPDASTKLLRFVSDDIWGSRGRCRVISRSIAAYLVQAWDVRNSCKHNGAVLPLPSAPEGRGADGVDA